MSEAKWLVAKSGKHTCSSCNFVTDSYTRTCPNCNADMGLTVKRLMKYKCGCCNGLFDQFAYRYDASPNGDDICVCPLCGCEEPDVEEVWENEVDN